MAPNEACLAPPSHDRHPLHLLRAPCARDTEVEAKELRLHPGVEGEVEAMGQRKGWAGLWFAQGGGAAL